MVNVMKNSRKWRFILIGILAGSCLSGCGNRGHLYLPDEQGKEDRDAKTALLFTASSASSPAAVPSGQSEEEYMRGILWD